MSVFEGFTHPYTLPSKGEIDPQFLEVNNYIHNSSSSWNRYRSTTWTTQVQHIIWEFVDKFVEYTSNCGHSFKQVRHSWTTTWTTQLDDSQRESRPIRWAQPSRDVGHHDVR